MRKVAFVALWLFAAVRLVGQTYTYVAPASNWYATITSQITYTWTGGTVSWTLTNTGGYSANGAWSMFKNGVIVASYGNGYGGPNQVWLYNESGSCAASVGDVMTCVTNAAPFTWTIGATQSFRMRGTNTDSTAIRIVVKGANGAVVWDSGSIAKGASYDSGVIDVTGNAPVTYQKFVAATLSGDGVTWVDTATPSTSNTPVTSGTVPTASNNPTPTPANPSPLGNSSAVNGTSGPIWSSTNAGATTTTGTALDKATYREGVADVIAAIQQSGNGNDPGPAGTAFPSTTTETVAVDASQVTGLLSKLPAVPVMPTVGTDRTFQIQWVWAPIGLNYTQTIDIGQWTDQMTVFRAVCTWMLGLMFWVGAVATVRAGVSSNGG